MSDGKLARWARRIKRDGVTLWFAGRAVEQREYVLEQ